jgi:hypothetical protein
MIELQRNILNWYTPKSNYLCQSIDRVCDSVDLTDSKVISAPMSVKMPKFCSPSVDVPHVRNGVPKL